MRNFIFALLITLTAFTVITYVACKQDKCKEVACVNGGACQEGVCICSSGFTGVHCETAIVTDPCAGMVCQNGGSCSGGTCSCLSGYEGVHCESKVNAKFVGVYTATNSCPESGSGYEVIITADPNLPTRVTIRNLENLLCNFGSPIDYIGTINGSTLTIDDNQCGTHMVASGTLTGNVINLQYTATFDTEPSYSCTMTLTK